MSASELAALVVKLAIAGAVLLLVNRIVDPLFGGGFLKGS